VSLMVMRVKPCSGWSWLMLGSALKRLDFAGAWPGSCFTTAPLPVLLAMGRIAFSGWG